jgi:uncharacterized protein YecE (DUF72 family)
VEKNNLYFFDPELFSEFIKQLTPLHNKIGILMLQFEYMNKSKISGLSELAERFEMFLFKIESPFPLGIELRKPLVLKKVLF